MTVLVADDDKAIVKALTLLLDSEHMESVACSNPAQVLEQVRSTPFQLALIDLNYHEDTTSGKEGLELISEIRKLDSELPVVVMTGWGTVSIAVEAMKRGAVDFIEKPWEKNDRLINTIRTQIQLRNATRQELKLRTENRLLKNQQANTSNLICNSQSMKEIIDLADRIAGSDIPVLITGENGTGKTLLAKYIHENSTRADHAFVAVNMGGISDSIFESEMFGHIKGAFTDAKNERVGRVELAEDGTLFMDEIANMPTQQQAKILRLLEEFRYERLGSSQTREASIRVISATNANLDKLVTEQGFRQDLLYRLNGVTLEIPPLRDRAQDILPLAKQFLQNANTHYDSAANAFSQQAVTELENYNWPGNVRELQHVIERAVLLCRHDTIDSSDLQLSPKQESAVAIQPDEFYEMTLGEAEAWYIQQVIEKHAGNHTRAAKALGISRSALYRRMDKARQ
ncbi:MAG: sigma-54 dependent transcriptional regulator [Pseudomonadales bacterium]|nr:sigma-54 dependent transcriptional regulator [Pseudomonadales bacterium]